MCKLLNIFLLLFLLKYALYAEEPVLATLVKITSNEKQEFKIGTYNFTCTPYGIITIEELYRDAKSDSVCRKSIFKFYEQNPNLEYFAAKKLKALQSYSMVFIDGKCVISTAGEKSLSEFLLDEGLAIKIPNSLEKEYDSYFHKSELEAKVMKKGIWEGNLPKECISSIENN